MIQTEASAYLQPLRDLARYGEFEALALLLAAGDHRRPVRDYLHGRLFALIINNHPSFLSDPKTSAWSLETAKHWSEVVARNAADPKRLPSLVSAMVAELRTWRPKGKGG